MNLYSFYIGWLLKQNPARLFQLLYQQPWYAELHRQWLTSLPLTEQSSVLELGCGPGLLAKDIARYGVWLNAVDYSSAMVQAAQKENAHTHSIAFTRASGHQLPYKENCFDVVLAASLVNIIKQPSALVDEVYRVLRPGGTFAFLVPSDAMHRKNADGFIATKGFRGFSASALRVWCRYSSKFNRERCVELMATHGFDNIQVATGLRGMVYWVTGEKDVKPPADI